MVGKCAEVLGKMLEAAPGLEPGNKGFAVLVASTLSFQIFIALPHTSLQVELWLSLALVGSFWPLVGTILGTAHGGGDESDPTSVARVYGWCSENF